MQRAQRALDNPALEAAIRRANELGKPVVVFFALLKKHPIANLRHYTFMIEGLIDTAVRLERRGIGLVIRLSSSPVADFLKFCEEVRPALAVIDENPLRNSARWRERAAEDIGVPLLSVDADVIVPSCVIGREHYAARTIRPRIRAVVERYLKPVGNLASAVRWKAPAKMRSLAPSMNILRALSIDESVTPATHIHGGSSQAQKILRQFIARRLRGYAKLRNRPEASNTSRLSPYLHFGQIGPQTIARSVMRSRAPAEDREAFLEELIVRRELAVNFVRYNSHYDRLEGCEPWALKTLRAHARDKRVCLYTAAQFERAETHDPLWNAAQRQMVRSGWMHGYLRMYWAKKILEWSPSAAEAFRVAVWLNDRYELDGRDPNGYAGVAWAIGGKHDRAWGPERPIYGMVRYMSYQSTRRKFASATYIARWAGDSATPV
jgi:deoxyribodipyrimidine photo-lyase